MLLFLSFLVVVIPTTCVEILCYSCISRIDSSVTTRSEQNALKTALFTRYNIPPSHAHCEDGGTDLLFRTVDQETCKGNNDSCVKISTGDPKGQMTLTIRGCHSSILKPGYELSEMGSCWDKESARCLSTCSTNLCNSAQCKKMYFIVFLLLYLLN